VRTCHRQAVRQAGPVTLCKTHLADLEKNLAYKFSQRPLRPGPGTVKAWVYFVQLGAVIKIGTSRQPKNRVVTFGAYGLPVRVLALEAGGRELEQKLHRRFNTDRADVGQSKELFMPTPAVLAYVDSGRTCTFCELHAQPDRVVCGRHRKRVVPEETLIGYAIGTPPPLVPHASPRTN